MTLICIASPKGGVGKTTLTANLAYTLQRLGLNVTVIDFDSQDALKLHFGIPVNDTQGYVAHAGTSADWRHLVRSTPSGINVLAYGHSTYEERYNFESFLINKPEAFKQALQGLCKSPGDIVLADLPPGHSGSLHAVCRLKPLCVTALLADSASLAVLPTIENKSFYPASVEGHIYYVINQLDLRNELSNDVYGLLKKRLGASLLGAVHRDAAVSEAHAQQISILQYAYTSAVVNDLEVIAHNIMRLLPDVLATQPLSRAKQ
ncbi:cellulose biosynthesis protein BcsQ [Vreelandella populi]|uniref:Cellulose synthase operon protein YhjQ n=1 Tax=Vreelandella populi TaxID=2498858 RepID=A0A433LBN4_9GAMM|nr:cellulose biosynthesis protein BcsQ [Halomonas populi]RUR39028.1 cellulose synthase operon protein YhjQ [Halomonas populi]RUR46088.1 cellulose synthase operon protein YhjQ [Halomonas populi]